jgi:hypothetical protein
VGALSLPRFPLAQVLPREQFVLELSRALKEFRALRLSGSDLKQLIPVEVPLIIASPDRVEQTIIGMAFSPR